SCIIQMMSSLFIGNLCYISDGLLKSYCSKYGTIVECTIKRDKDGNTFHCFAFVTYRSIRAIDDIMRERPHYIRGKEVLVKRALPRQLFTVQERLVLTRRLILNDIDNRVHDERSIRLYFQTYGRILCFKLDKKNRCCFIDYDDYDCVDHILIRRPHYIHRKELKTTKYIPVQGGDHESPRNRSYGHEKAYHFLEEKYSNDEQDVEQQRSNTPSPLLSSAVVVVRKEKSLSPTLSLTIDDEIDEIKQLQTELIQYKTDYENMEYKYRKLEDEYQSYKREKELELSELNITHVNQIEKIKQLLLEKNEDYTNKIDRIRQDYDNKYRENCLTIQNKNNHPLIVADLQQKLQQLVLDEQKHHQGLIKSLAQLAIRTNVQMDNQTTAKKRRHDGNVD
ncbi:unnamed protein product, partial [Didymodactylos carnosus]